MPKTTQVTNYLNDDTTYENNAFRKTSQSYTAVESLTLYARP